MKNSILFVDDEPNVLQGIRRSLREMRDEWNMDFASNGEEALKRMEESPCDVIVSDMRMPGIDGAELLAEVMKLYPGTVRIVLSGQTDEDALTKAVGAAHQFLTKPFEADRLKPVIDRAFRIRTLLENESLRDLLCDTRSMPSLPDLYLAIVEELQSEDPSIRKIGEIVGQDVGMSAKLIQIVNSVIFGTKVQVTDPSQAAVYIGIDMIKALVLSIKVFSQFSDPKIKRFVMKDLWAHSFRIGALSQRLCKLEGLSRELVDEAFLAGLLHDIGKAILASTCPGPFGDALEMAERESIPPLEAEECLLGTTHAEVGAYLVGMWGLPEPVFDAVLHHHDPSQSTVDSFGPMPAVYVANLLDTALVQDADEIAVDWGFLRALGKPDRMEDWEDVCQGLHDELGDAELV